MCTGFMCGHGVRPMHLGYIFAGKIIIKMLPVVSSINLPQ